MNKYFMHRIKHNVTTDADTDYVQVEVTDMGGNRLLFEVWNGIVTPEPEGVA